MFPAVISSSECKCVASINCTIEELLGLVPGRSTVQSAVLGGR